MLKLACSVASFTMVLTAAAAVLCISWLFERAAFIAVMAIRVIPLPGAVASEEGEDAGLRSMRMAEEAESDANSNHSQSTHDSMPALWIAHGQQPGLRPLRACCRRPMVGTPGWRPLDSFRQ